MASRTFHVSPWLLPFFRSYFSYRRSLRRALDFTRRRLPFHYFAEYASSRDRRQRERRFAYAWTGARIACPPRIRFENFVILCISRVCTFSNRRLLRDCTFHGSGAHGTTVKCFLARITAGTGSGERFRWFFHVRARTDEPGQNSGVTVESGGGRVFYRKIDLKKCNSLSSPRGPRWKSKPRKRISCPKNPFERYVVLPSTSTPQYARSNVSAAIKYRRRTCTCTLSRRV